MMEPRIIAKISGTRKELIAILLESGVTFKKAKDSIIVELQVTNITDNFVEYRIPKPISGIAELQIHCAEYGYNGVGVVCCDSTGVLMEPYYINKNGLAFFCSKWGITQIRGWQDGVYKIDEYKIRLSDSDDYTVILEKRDVPEENIKNDISMTKLKYGYACEAAIKRARSKDPLKNPVLCVS